MPFTTFNIVNTQEDILVYGGTSELDEGPPQLGKKLPYTTAHQID